MSTVYIAPSLFKTYNVHIQWKEKYIKIGDPTMSENAFSTDTSFLSSNCAKMILRKLNE